MSFPAVCRGDAVPVLRRSSCFHFSFQPMLLPCYAVSRLKPIDFSTKRSIRIRFNVKRGDFFRCSATETGPDKNEDEEKKLHEEETSLGSTDSSSSNNSQPSSSSDQVGYSFTRCFLFT
ncbi:unnamed protein product [Cuscuta campestris]|uniref:Uncharacterized protein n=1 Tax=Cuscuta campestris TaxID=132261 RepID=A0A484LM68_9ASTE|nr:unnamed protein product [Cuscuta campestris]